MMTLIEWLLNGILNIPEDQFLNNSADAPEHFPYIPNFSKWILWHSWHSCLTFLTLLNKLSDTTLRGSRMSKNGSEKDQKELTVVAV